ncbi:BCCT family transporter [Desulfosporosinus sp. BICA1-9]|uniref:glycine betaine uptake BCCT transporter n=1 Tax=Desulfosporosinus sp. BICA1-9 TaxID=1531958 RepID=UPI00054C54DA|nr:BCCT family transporter [Desulfosporosinus sp. BICA1-9]KJS50062.1 MAG: glycine/betaine ABC transporter permease [Peptococcaceae bacterium BRH_c23]KJS89095.1 MAG: glycine/betaine ABC transporter permease [Desulfosporosinus sp. BICA1-9]HBW36828.1 BCCT family transporter [Desulfosporosinus sp.]
MSEKESLFGKIDRPIFSISAAIMVLFVIFTLLMPKEAGDMFNAVQKFITNNFGWSYLIGVTFFLFFALFIALSKYGNITLGKDGEKPEYSTWSWFAMLFAAGMGIGLLFWGVAEPMTHYTKPPFGQPSTIESAQTAMRYTFFHWGFHPWSVFGIVGLSMAYFQFRKGLPALVSSSLYPIIGEKGIKGWIGKLVDILAVFATIFGVATSLGLGATQIATGLNYAYGLPTGIMPSVVIIVVITALFIISAVTGIERGIKFLSNANMLLLFIILAFMLIIGPTRFVLNGFTETFGSYVQNIIQMSFWADTFETNPGWVGGWTIFYWAWWVAWGPFVGAFIARISKGRTVREFILGVVIAPALMSFMWLGVIGNSALYIDVVQHGGIATQVTKDMSTAIFAMFQHYPLTGVLTVLTTIIIAIFFITSADSATFVLAMFTSGGELNPNAGLKITWGLIEGAVAIALMIAGGLSALQTASITAAFPFMFVMFAMTVSIIKAFRGEFT